HFFPHIALDTTRRASGTMRTAPPCLITKTFPGHLIQPARPVDQKQIFLAQCLPGGYRRCRVPAVGTPELDPFAPAAPLVLFHALRGGLGRPPARRSALCRARCRLRLEVLEGRCLPSTVTNLNDAGAGSLRQAILDTPAGGTVDFQPGLAGTITLTSG